MFTSEWTPSCTVTSLGANNERILLTQISSIFQANFRDPSFTAEVMISNVGSLKIGLCFTKKVP